MAFKKSCLQYRLQKEEKSFLWDLAGTPLSGLLNSALVVSQPPLACAAHLGAALCPVGP